MFIKMDVFIHFCRRLALIHGSEPGFSDRGSHVKSIHIFISIIRRFESLIQKQTDRCFGIELLPTNNVVLSMFFFLLVPIEKVNYEEG